MRWLRRLKRWIFNGLTVLSLLLFIIVGFLWVRGIRYSDGIFYTTQSGITYQISTAHKGIEFYTNNGIKQSPAATSDDPRGWSTFSDRWADGWMWNPPEHYRFGFGWESGGGPDEFHYLNVDTPFWYVMFLFSLPPLVWSLRWWKRRRIKHGLCLVCGYDLRASKDRCPECGTAIPLVHHQS